MFSECQCFYLIVFESLVFLYRDYIYQNIFTTYYIFKFDFNSFDYNADNHVNLWKYYLIQHFNKMLFLVLLLNNIKNIIILLKCVIKEWIVAVINNNNNNIS